MPAATADSTASIRIETRSFPYGSASDARRASRYIRWASRHRPRSHDRWTETLIRVSGPAKPIWLWSVQQRIRRSILPFGREAENDGRWLSEDVADAGFEFFQLTADLLPGEPFIYSTRRGDLTAEFVASHGILTSIVSPGFALLYAIVDGFAVERKFSRDEWHSAGFRNDIRRLTSMLTTGRDGAVEATN